MSFNSFGCVGKPWPTKRFVNKYCQMPSNGRTTGLPDIFSMEFCKVSPGKINTLSNDRYIPREIYQCLILGITDLKSESMSSKILTLHTSQKDFVSEDYSHIVQVYFVDNFWPFTP